jgi:hypothetical protein
VALGRDGSGGSGDGSDSDSSGVWRSLLDLRDEVCSKVHSKLLAVALECVDIGVKCRREATDHSLAVLELAELHIKD